VENKPCQRCLGTGYCRPWGDSSSNSEELRRCNHCDFHRGPEREREIARAKKLLEENGYYVAKDNLQQRIDKAIYELTDDNGARIRTMRALEALRGPR
jgi:hypothetical protein